MRACGGGGALIVTVIGIGNGFWDSSSNRGRICLRFTLCLA